MTENLMRAGIVGVALLVMAGGSSGCGGGSGDPSGAVDAGNVSGDAAPAQDGSTAPSDSGVLTAGLRLTFGSDPALPGALGGDPFGAYIEEVRVDLEDLRVVGDSETGQNTTRPFLALRWGDGGGGEDDGGDDLRQGGQGPGDIEVQFPTAPPGYYSLVKADISSYRARGTVELDGGTDFEIDDTPPTPISISISLDDLLLDAGTIRTVSIHLALSEVVGDVPWDAIDADGGDDLKIESDDPEIAAVRAAMGRAFAAAVLDAIE
jgi:hypothetical protein